MKKNVGERKLYKDVKVRNEEPTQAVEAKNVNVQENKRIKAVEPTTQNIAVDEWEMEQREIGGLVAQALAVLTAAGVVEWHMGQNWARACLRIHVHKYEPLVVCERGEWAEDVERDEFGEFWQEFYGFADGEYRNLTHHIHRNWVYPEGY